MYLIAVDREFEARQRRARDEAEPGLDDIDVVLVVLVLSMGTQGSDTNASACERHPKQRVNIVTGLGVHVTAGALPRRRT